MYARHFGLSQDPFSIAPDPRYLFMSERHREALAHLLFGVTGSAETGSGGGGGFVLLTGDIGTGKTTICRCFLAQIPAGCHVAYIFNPKLSVSELLQSVCEEFHIAPPQDGAARASVKDYIDALNTFLLQSHAAGQASVLVIDEAQNLAPEVLEQLRLLTNLETNERKLLQIVLIGQPELRAMLARPELEQLAQRVIARFHLDALTPSETTAYIAHRLAVAGHQGALPFDARALQRIHRLSHGVPRRINLLCGRALLGAWANGLQRVNRAVVDQAAREVFGPGEPARGSAARRPALRLGLALLLVAAIGVAGWLWPSPAVTPAPPASPQVGPTAPQNAPLDDLVTLLPQLPRQMPSAWRELAPVWQLTLTDADPCQTGRAQLVCYRGSRLTLPLLRQLARPGILTLQLDNGEKAYAVLTGLTEQTATLQLNGHPHRVRLVALAALWRGDFATYWQTPEGYSDDLRAGSSGPAIDWLAHHLGRLDGVNAPSTLTTLDNELRARLRAFQRVRGITPDGLPGPMTFMQLESALDLQRPRLAAALPATPP